MTPRQIRSLRDHFGDTQPEFYDRLGMQGKNNRNKRQTISRWELGARNPSSAAQVLLDQLKTRAN